MISSLPLYLPDGTTDTRCDGISVPTVASVCTMTGPPAITHPREGGLGHGLCGARLPQGRGRSRARRNGTALHNSCAQKETGTNTTNTSRHARSGPAVSGTQCGTHKTLDTTTTRCVFMKEPSQKVGCVPFLHSSSSFSLVPWHR